MIPYSTYKLKYQARNIQQLRVARSSGIFGIVPFIDIMYHHISESDADVGIKPTNPLIANTKSAIRLHHTEKLTVERGRPIPRIINATELLTAYFREVSGYIDRIRNMERVLKEHRSYLIEDYSLLVNKYKYLKTRTSHFDEWFNLKATIAAGIKAIGNKRTHLILFKLPDEIPEIIRLRSDTKEDEIPTSKISYWSDSDRFSLWYLWKLMQGKFHYLDGLDEHVNIIIQDGTLATQFNLKDLRDWWTKDDHTVEVAFYALFTNLRKKKNNIVVEGDTESEATSEIDTHVDQIGVDSPDKEAEEPEDDTVFHEERNTAEDAELPPPGDTADASTDTTETTWLTRSGESQQTMVSLPKALQMSASQQKTMAASKPASAPAMKPAALPENEYIDTEYMEATFDDLLSSGHLSTAERARYIKLASGYKTLPNPFGRGTLRELVTVPPEKKTLTTKDFPIPEKASTILPEASKSTVSGFTPKYIKEVMEADIASAVLNIQKANVFVSQYAVTEHRDAVNHYKKYTVTLNPIVGKQSTISFTLPVISESGEFVANNTLRRLDNQIGDLPIRKLKPSRVALTSYYGKTFVDRSKNVVNNFGRWITARISKASVIPGSGITGVIYTSAALPRISLPRKYTAIGDSIASFETPDYRFNFLYDQRESLYGSEVLSKYEVDGRVVCGVSKKQKAVYLVIDTQGVVYQTEKGGFTALGPLETVIHPDWSNSPIEYASIAIYGKNVPVVLVLCSLMGLATVLKRYKIPHRWSDTTRVDTEAHEIRVRCSGGSLYVDRRHPVGGILFGGFYEIRQQIAEYDASELNRTGMYGYLLETAGIGRHVLKEIGLMDRLFVDPITKEILKDMGEPVDFRDLLVRASTLLNDDNSTDEIDPAYMRIRGYERISGFVYNQLIAGMRTHLAAPNPTKSSVSINPTSVWSDLISDEAITLVEDSNPIHSLKELESVTFSGQGGRSGETMMANSRLFHKNAVGLFSEATPDSGKVGTRSYMPPNAKLTSVRGTCERYDYNKDTLVSAFSTPALIAPGATSMDPKRINLGSIQQTAMVSSSGSKVMPVRTGYEQIIAHRCADRFATMAKQDGKVVSVSNTAIVVEYKDKTKQSVALGTLHGVASGAVIPHTVVTDLSPGDTVKQGDALAWNQGYFKRDYLNKGGCSMVGGVPARVAFIENTDTLEDGSAISERLSKELSTPSSKNKTLFVSFSTSVRELVKVGQQVDVDTVLGIIEEGGLDVISGSDATLSGLSKLSGATPKAKQKGIVTNIEVIYYGDPADMHPTLAVIAKEADARLAKRVKESGSTLAPTGRVYDSLFVNKNRLTEKTMAITIYIDFSLDCNVGDKVVYDNALKSIIGRVMTGVNETEDGRPIDALFGYRSVFARITPCVESTGVTNTTLMAASKRLVEIYRKG